MLNINDVFVHGYFVHIFGKGETAHFIFLGRSYF